MKHSSNYPVLNYYRTKKFIVEQKIYLDYLSNGNSIVFSKDTYFSRNLTKDKKYEKTFKSREEIDGKRIYVGFYKRKYEI